MTRCHDCEELNIEFLVGYNHAWKDGLASLVSSAEAGCEFCQIAWASLQVNNTKASLDAASIGLYESGEAIDDPRIWLWGAVYPDAGRVPKPGGGTQADTIWVTCDEATGKQVHGRVSGRLIVFARPNTPAALHLPGRWIDIEGNPHEDLSFARRWLKFCRANHPECTLAPIEGGMPTRLIDMGDPALGERPKIVDTVARGLTAPYAALSYCWGNDHRRVEELTDDKLIKMQEELDEDSLALTYKETMRLTRELGLRYLWVDCLCIVQGSARDWEHESKRMATVYGNSTLTLIAGRSADRHAGFIKNEALKSKTICALPYGNGKDMGQAFVSLPRSYAVGPTNDRAWCFQESALSARAVIFAEELISFRCQRIDIREDGMMSNPENSQIRKNITATALPQSSTSDRGHESRESTDEHSLVNQDAARQQILRTWYRDIVNATSKRGLTEPFDIFAVTTSLAQLAQPKIRSRYLAGIWEVDIARGLLWRPRHAIQMHPSFLPLARPRHTSRKRLELLGKIAVRAPSWSWAAVMGEVYHIYLERKEGMYCDRTKWLIQPKLTRSADNGHIVGVWTRDEHEDHVDRIIIPKCDLLFFGKPKRVRYSQRPVSELKRGIFQHRKSLISSGQLVALESVIFDTQQSSAEESRTVVGVGGFDVVDEKTEDELWCLPLIREEGLLLHRDAIAGKFKRLGLVSILDEGWAASGEEQEVCLE
ncbi:heterokaryon incompatibility protein-domain-containing protein [Xylariaceae sp. FL0016]|nr:heterokaryon incompatibility protein-domain-containing protein [Xylariaceae sp. FL0016]